MLFYGDAIFLEKSKESFGKAYSILLNNEVFVENDPSKNCQNYPDRDYLIVTQPHTVPENALFSKFTLVQKQMANTFSHVLYLIHRDYLLEQDLAMTRTKASDLEGIE